MRRLKPWLSTFVLRPTLTMAMPSAEHWACAGVRVRSQDWSCPSWRTASASAVVFALDSGALTPVMSSARERQWVCTAVHASHASLLTLNGALQRIDAVGHFLHCRVDQRSVAPLTMATPAHTSTLDLPTHAVEAGLELVQNAVHPVGQLVWAADVCVGQRTRCLG